MIIQKIHVYKDLFSDKNTSQIKLDLSGNNIILTAENNDFNNKAKEVLKCDYDGEDMQIGFNSKFLSEMLSNLDSDDVVLNMSLPNKAGVLYPLQRDDNNEELTALVMPVLIS